MSKGIEITRRQLLQAFSGMLLAFGIPIGQTEERRDRKGPITCRSVSVSEFHQHSSSYSWSHNSNGAFLLLAGAGPAKSILCNGVPVTRIMQGEHEMWILPRPPQGWTTMHFDRVEPGMCLAQAMSFDGVDLDHPIDYTHGITTTADWADDQAPIGI